LAMFSIFKPAGAILAWATPQHTALNTIKTVQSQNLMLKM
jgi:hypothetical protein